MMTERPEAVGPSDVNISATGSRIYPNLVVDDDELPLPIEMQGDLIARQQRPLRLPARRACRDTHVT
jgi:hypothetical protein